MIVEKITLMNAFVGAEDIWLRCYYVVCFLIGLNFASPSE